MKIRLDWKFSTANFVKQVSSSNDRRNVEQQAQYNLLSEIWV